MRLFSFRKPLSLNVMDGTCVVNDLARNYKYVRVHHPQLGNVLMYEDILIPGTKAYYTAKGKFILLEKRFVSRCEDPGSPGKPGKVERIVFTQRYLANGDCCETHRVYLTNGTVADRLTERSFTLQIGAEIYVLKSRLTNGVWRTSRRCRSPLEKCSQRLLPALMSLMFPKPLPVSGTNFMRRRTSALVYLQKMAYVISMYNFFKEKSTCV